MELKELIKTIQPDNSYSLKGAIKMGIFEKTFGYKSYPPCLSFILRDRSNKNGGILKAEIAGEGKGTLYIMKGKNIINFLKMYEKKIATKSDSQKNC